jgi:transposase
MLYLAIDQHSKQLTVNVRDESGQIVLRKQVSTRGEAPREFLTQLAQRAGADGYVTIVEVCGFNDWLLDLLPHCGCRETVLVQPGEPGKRKTDRRDANQLGEVLWVNRYRLLARQRVQGLRRVNIPGVRERDDRRLAALRHRVGRELTRVINRVWTVLRRRNLQHDCPTKTIQSKRARVWLTQLAVSPLDRLELDQLLARWQLLVQHRSVLETTIAERVAQCPDAQLLTTLPSAGSFMALGLAAHVGDITRFPRPRSLANYWGLTPSCRNSGEKNQRLGSISKEGSNLARFLLGQLVMHVLKHDGRLRAWYLGIKRRRGAKIARVAVMRRLTTIIWHMLTHREAYRRGGVRRAEVNAC